MCDEWCPVCCTRHAIAAECPGELLATSAERFGWRVNVETPQGIEAYAVLVSQVRDRWRSRIITYPNVLWLVPRGRGTLKFLADRPQEAESQAVDFIREHCRSRGYKIRQRVSEVVPGSFDPEARVTPAPPSAPRVIRFLPVRFGVVGATEPGGTGNLSENGLFIITRTPVLSGSNLKMTLGLDDDPVALAGQVRWMRDKPHVGRSPGMGVQLNAPPAQYTAYVRSLC